ncbi:MAG: tyrosine-type recombinase/integrase [Phycicoccus sp.]
MGHVTKDARDGRWLARWRDPDGRQRKKSFPRRTDADRFLVALTAEQHRGTYIAPAAGKVTVEVWVRRWSDGLSHLKASTAARYRSILRVHVLPRWGRWPLACVTHAEVAAWVSTLSVQGLAPGSVRQVHRVLSLVLDLAVRDGSLARNPAAGVRLPRQVRDEPVFLTMAQVEHLATAAGDHGPELLTLCLTGLRFGELAALRGKRLDVARRRLVVAESVTEVDGRLVWSTPKTHQTRATPVPRSVLPLLLDAAHGKAPDDLLFTAPEGGPLRLRNWRRNVFDRACERAGLVDSARTTCGTPPRPWRSRPAPTSRRCSACSATPRRR